MIKSKVFFVVLAQHSTNENINENTDNGYCLRDLIAEQKLQIPSLSVLTLSVNIFDLYSACVFFGSISFFGLRNSKRKK